MRTKRSVNYVAVLILLVGTSLLGLGVHLLHAYQVKRNAHTLLDQADLAERDGETNQVADYLGQYLGMAPNDTSVLARYGLLLDKQATSARQRQRAFEILDKVVRLDASRQDVRRQLVRAALDLGQVQDARFHLAILQKEVGDDSELFHLQARCEADAGQLWKARDLYKQAIEKDPADVDLCLEFAALLRQRLQQPDEADDAVDKLLKEAPRSLPAHLAAARYYQRFASPDNGFLDKAEKAVALALNAPGAHEAETYLLAAEIAEARKMPVEARDRLEQGLRKQPGEARLKQGLARMELQAGRPQTALLALESTLRTPPSKPEELWAQGNLLIELGQKEKVEEVILRLDAGGHKWAADCLRGRVSMRQEAWGQARALLERAKTGHPPTTALTAQRELLLAVCYEHLGNPDQQLQAGRRALEGDPTLMPARRSVANALATLGKTAEAMRQYQLLAERTLEDEVELAHLLLAANAALPPANRQWAELEQAIKRIPTSPAARLVQAELLVAQGQEQDARSLVEAERTRDDQQLAPWLLLIALAEKEDQGRGVLPLLDEADRRVGRRVEWDLARANHWLLAAPDKAQPELEKLEADLKFFKGADREKLLRGLGQAFLVAGDRKSSARLWSELAKRQPENVEVRFHLLELAYRDERGDELARLVEEVRRLEGGGGALTGYGEATRLLLRARGGDKGALAGARQKMHEIESLRPSWSAVALLQAEAFELERRSDKALEKYQAALARGEARLWVVRRVLELLAAQGRFAEAQALLGKMPERMQVVSGLDRLGVQLALVNREPAGDNPTSAARRRGLEAAREKVAADSTDYRDYLWLGNMCLLAGERADAEKAFRRARELGDTMPETWAALILTLARTAPDKAEAEMAAAKAKVPREVLWQVLASGYEALGRLELAEGEFKTGLAAQPDDLVLLRAAASFYARNGQAGKAEPCLRKLIDRKAKAPEATAAWARRTLAIGLAFGGTYQQFREAQELVKEQSDETSEDRVARALVLATRSEHRREAIRAFEGLSTGGARVASELQFILAQVYETNGDWPKARAQLHSLLKDDEKNPVYLAYFVRASLRNKEVEEAQTALDRLDQLDGPAFVRLELRARVLHASGKSQDAVKVLDGYAHEKDARLDAVASLLNELGQPEAAEKLYREYARNAAEPTNALLLARHLGRYGHILEALAICEQARQTCPAEKVAAASVAVLRAGRGTSEQYQEVERWLTAARSKNSGSKLLAGHLGELEDNRGRHQQALALYRELLQQDPQNVIAMNNSAYIMALTGHPAEGLEMIENAIALAGPVPALLDTRAVVRLQQDRAASAVSDLQQAIVQTQSASFYFHLAQAQVKAKNLRVGRAAWEKANALGLTSADLHPLEQASFIRIKDDLKVE